MGAGLLMPAVGATGTAARHGVRVFDSLPSQFALTPLSQRFRILASDGTLIAIPNGEQRRQLNRVEANRQSETAQ